MTLSTACRGATASDLPEERPPLPPRLFILHADEDRAFVEGFLLPALGLADEELVLSSRLRPGAPLLDELTRGAGCPVTLVLLSPAFHACPWRSLAEQLAQHASLEFVARGAIWIPALLGDCELALLARSRVALDFRDRRRWEAEVARLRARLALPPPAAARPAKAPSGLRAFERRNADWRCGRAPELAELLARLRACERELRRLVRLPPRRAQLAARVRRQRRRVQTLIAVASVLGVLVVVLFVLALYALRLARHERPAAMRPGCAAQVAAGQAQRCMRLLDPRAELGARAVSAFE